MGLVVDDVVVATWRRVGCDMTCCIRLVEPYNSPHFTSYCSPSAFVCSALLAI